MSEAIRGHPRQSEVIRYAEPDGQRGRTAENVDEDQRGYERCGQAQRVLQRVRPDR
jgi:hypothetical protein